MSSYQKLLGNQKNILRDIIERAKPYLAKNQLDEMYDDIDHCNEPFESFHRNFLGYITEFLEDCGINTVSALLSGGIIPGCYARMINNGAMHINADLIDNQTFKGNKALHFPPQIKRIGPSAFENNNCFNILDLRGIESIDDFSFAGIGFIDIIINDSLSYIGTGAFDDTFIQNVYCDHRDIDEVKELFKNCEDETLKNTEFKELI